MRCLFLCLSLLQERTTDVNVAFFSGQSVPLTVREVTKLLKKLLAFLTRLLLQQGQLQTIHQTFPIMFPSISRIVRQLASFFFFKKVLSSSPFLHKGSFHHSKKACHNSSERRVLLLLRRRRRLTCILFMNKDRFLPSCSPSPPTHLPIHPRQHALLSPSCVSSPAERTVSPPPPSCYIEGKFRLLFYY